VTDWRVIPIRELCSSIIDCVNKTAPVVEGPTPYRMIRTTNVRYGRIDTAAVRYVDEATYRRWVRRGEPRVGDIVLTREAPLGEVGMLRDAAGIFLGQRLVMYRVDPTRADTRFLLYAMQGSSVQSQIKAYGSGSTVEHMRVPDCGELMISCPALTEQRRIGSILAAFDDLIEINERRIVLLEELARSIYREWFVRFRFRGDRHSGSSEPGVGRLPHQWTYAPLFDVAEVGFGYSFKSPLFGAAGPHPVIRIRDVPKGTTNTFTTETAPDRYAVRDRDVLIGMDGEFHLNQWFGGPAWLNQRVARLRPTSGMSSRHLMLSIADAIRAWNASIVGTTVAHLGKRHLEEIRVLVPPADQLREMARIFDTLADAQLHLQQVNRRVAATRVLLLPRLVTGHLDISEIDLGDLLESEAA
jgi:type I restriction enzyme S subunit